MNDTHHANYQVETSLGDVARALWRRKWILLLVVPLFLIGTYFYTQRLPKQWQAEGQMLIVQRAGAAPVGPQGYIPPATESVSTQIGMLRTAAMADRALSWLKNKELRDGQPLDTEGIGIGTLQNAVNVSSPADSDLINLSVLGTSRDQAILLTNAVAQSFVQWKQEEARKDIQKTERTLAAQNATAKKRLDAARLRQLTYQKGHSILDPVAQAENGVQQERERKNAVDQITEERDSEQTNVNFLKNQVDAANVSIQKVGVRNDELTAKLQSQLSDLKIQRKALARVVTPAYPGKLPDIDQLIANVQQELNTAVKATQSGTSSTLPAQATMVQQYHQAQDQLAATESRLTDAVAQEDAATKAILPLVVTSSTYEQVARQAQDASRSYNDLQAALQSAKLLESHINGDIQITQQAVAPDRPAKPSLPLNMLMGGLLGLLTALGAIFVIEQLDRRVRTEDQVERLGSGPILGALPRLSRASLALLGRKQLPVPVAESYSLTGANLLRVLGSTTPGLGRIVMVTSAQAGEGKSLTAAELARSLARSGKRVILVDADMRRPALNALFESPSQDGLIEVLSGKVLLDDALAASETPNLSVLFNNSSRANSADIIVSPHMTNFLQTIRSRAEVIVLDTPSCTVVDPLLLAPSVDYVLQVIDLGRANEDAVNSTSSVLSGLAPLGLFINRTSKRNAPAYEVARSFAATLERPGLTTSGEPAPYSADHTLMMFRNTSGYTAGHINGTADPLADPGKNGHDYPVPLKPHEDK